MDNHLTVGHDLAKQVFQVHGTDSQGATIFTRKIRRHDLLAFFEKLDPCLVGVEACGSAHYGAREIGSLGHEVRILPVPRVKPFVIRGKTDATDAAAINTALKQPDVRPVPVKTAQQQAYAMLLRTGPSGSALDEASLPYTVLDRD